MSGPIRDSISRCDQFTTIYDTIRNPNLPNIPPPTNSVMDQGKDTIQSTQQRLNREVLERFQNSGLKLSHETFMAVAQVGKYLFLAIMLPPYLCLYGIPKWMLMQLIPQCYQIITTATLRIGRFFQKLAKRIPDLMKGILKQLLGNAISVMNRQSRNIWNFIAQVANRFTVNLQGHWNALKATKERLKRGFARESAKMFGGLKRKYDDLQEQAQKKLVLFWEKTKKLVNKVLKFINDFLISPIVQFLTPPLKAIKRVIGVVWNALNSNSTKLYRWIGVKVKLVSKKVTHSVQRIAASIKKIALKLALPLLNRINQFSHSIATYIQSWRSKWTSLKKPRNVTWIHNIKSLVGLGFSKIKRGFIKIPSIMMAIGRGLWRLVPEKTMHSWQVFCDKVFAFGRFFLRIGALFRRVMNISGHVLQRFSQRVLQKLQQGRQTVVYMFQKFRRELVYLPKRFIRASIKAFEFLEKVMLSMILGFRLFVAWIYALFYMGILVIRNFLANFST